MDLPFLTSWEQSFLLRTDEWTPCVPQRPREVVVFSACGGNHQSDAVSLQTHTTTEPLKAWVGCSVPQGVSSLVCVALYWMGLFFSVSCVASAHSCRTFKPKLVQSDCRKRSRWLLNLKKIWILMTLCVWTEEMGIDLMSSGQHLLLLALIVCEMKLISLWFTELLLCSLRRWL